MKVKDAMHRGVTCVDPGTSLRDIAVMMRDQDVGSIPVNEDNRLIGMVTDRDIVCRVLADGRDPRNVAARDVMTPSVIHCNEDEELGDALHLMETKQVRRLPVLNGEKWVVGILAMGDISATASRELSGEAIKALSAHHA